MSEKLPPTVQSHYLNAYVLAPRDNLVRQVREGRFMTIVFAEGPGSGYQGLTSSGPVSKPGPADDGSGQRPAD
jgi:hypothetical protein